MESSALKIAKVIRKQLGKTRLNDTRTKYKQGALYNIRKRKEHDIFLKFN